VMNATVTYTATRWPFALTRITPAPVATTLAGPPAAPGVILIDVESTCAGRQRGC
jgi:hypothetical protein